MYLLCNVFYMDSCMCAHIWEILMGHGGWIHICKWFRVLGASALTQELTELITARTIVIVTV